MDRSRALGRAPAATLDLTGATPELRQLVESLIATAGVSPDATLSDIRQVVAGDSIFTSGEGELLYPQDRTYLLIELDELIARQGPRAAPTTRKATKGRKALARKHLQEPLEGDENLSEASRALYGAADDAERSTLTEESVEDPLCDWPESVADVGLSQTDRSGRNDEERDR